LTDLTILTITLIISAINLSNCSVTSLAGISTSHRLRHLIVRNHLMAQLPDDMATLTDTLESLDVSNGPLQELPKFICECSRLRALNVANTLLSQLPADIGHLVRLRALDLTRCPIGTLPESVRNMRVIRDNVYIFLIVHFACGMHVESLRKFLP
jgi:Leucine-rich repeat (LRR) protein